MVSEFISLFIPVNNIQPPMTSLTSASITPARRIKIEPTIINNATFEDDVMQEEIFGPILPIVTYDSLENLKSMHIPNFIIDGMNIDGIYYHPTFFYESIWCLLGFVLLLILRKFLKERKNGELTCVYLMWYSVGRFFIEQLRTDSLMIGPFKVAQLVSLSCFVIGLLFYLYLAFFKKEKKVK